MEIIKKFNWRWLMMLAAVMMLGVTMTACGDDDDDDEPDNGALAGIYANLEELQSGEDEVFCLKVNADGTGCDGYWYPDENYFEYEDDDEHVQWRYRDEDGHYNVYDLDGDRLPFYVTVSGNKLYQHENDGEVIVYQKVK